MTSRASRSQGPSSLKRWVAFELTFAILALAVALVATGHGEGKATSGLPVIAQKPPLPLTQVVTTRARSTKVPSPTPTPSPTLMAPAVPKVVPTVAVTPPAVISKRIDVPVVLKPAVAAPVPVVTGDSTTRDCVNSRASIDALNQFSQLVGKSIDCSLVYNADPSWQYWVRPWYAHHSDPNYNWANWVKAVPGRRLIISQTMIPGDAPTDWRQRGANGEYDAYVAALAQDLVANGLGNSVIRLGWEMNGSWMQDSIGSTQSDYDAWRAYWRRIVLVMRSVPGAHFSFDWCINAGYRAIPFASYYPGDDVVDIIGGDIYDVLAANMKASTPQDRWNVIYNQPGGLASLIAFAHSRAKPISIPEWAVVAPGAVWEGAGDDPYFVDQISAVMHTNSSTYQSYFESTTGNVGMLLSDAPNSAAAYRNDYVTHG